MKACPSCTAQIPDAARVCQHCGRDVGIPPAAIASLVTLGLFVLLAIGVWWISISF